MKKLTVQRVSAFVKKKAMFSKEVTLPSTGLKFVPTANRIDRKKLKTELEVYGRNGLCGTLEMINNLL